MQAHRPPYRLFWLCLVFGLGCPTAVTPTSTDPIDPDGDDDDSAGDDDDDTGAVEICTDGVDNDVDGWIDCLDEDCEAHPACLGDDDDDDDDDDSVADLAPVADAGDDLEVVVGALVEPSGARSYDPEERPLRYAWSLLEAPPSSTSELIDADTVTPELVPDEVGVYTLLLTVTDAADQQDEDELLVIALADSGEDLPPVADAGPDQNVTVGGVVQLDGGASYDPEGAGLTFAWGFRGYASAGPPALSPSPGSPLPTFVATDAGLYRLELSVFDGAQWSEVDEVLIEAVEEDEGGCGLCGALAADVLRGQDLPLHVSLDRPRDRALAGMRGAGLLFAFFALAVRGMRRHG